MVSFLFHLVKAWKFSRFFGLGWAGFQGSWRFFSFDANEDHSKLWSIHFLEREREDIHTYIHTCMHACMHACMHTYTVYIYDRMRYNLRTKNLRDGDSNLGSLTLDIMTSDGGQCYSCPRLANEKPSRLGTPNAWHTSWGCLETWSSSVQPLVICF